MNVGRRRSHASLMIALSIALAIGAGCRMNGGDEDGPGPNLEVLVHAVRAHRQPIRLLLETAGMLAPVLGSEARVAAGVEGTVARIVADEGAVVAAGDAIAEIDPVALHVGSVRAAAEVGQARSALALATERVERARGLNTRGIVAGREVREAEAEETQARGQLASAMAALELARAEAGRAVVRSPVSGVVLHRAVTAGEYVQPDTVMFEVAPVARLELACAAPASTMAGLAVGLAAEVDCPSADGAVLTGAVARVSPALDPRSGTGTVRVAVDNETGALRPGMPCAARIVRARHPAAVVVPVSAVTWHDEGARPTIAVIDVASTARLREVTTGLREGDLVEIVEGLAEGEEVVAEGSYGLADGTRVRRDDAAGGNAPAPPASDR